MKNYKELHIWQKGIEIVKQVYLLNKQFPDTEKFEEEIKMIHRFINTLNNTNNIQTIKEKLTANS